MATSLRTTAAAGVVLVAVGTSISGPAVADPVNAPEIESLPLTCDGQTYQVVVNGNGAFTPAHDTDSTRMFIPTSFGEFTGTITDAQGEVIDSFTEPPMAKGSSTKARSTSVDCTFTFSEDFVDPELGPLHFEGSGEVTGFYTPARG
jgi:hypothetical protein